MKQLAAAVMIAVALAACSQPLTPADVAGTWYGMMSPTEEEGLPVPVTMKFRVHREDAVSGTFAVLGFEGTLDGRVSGNRLEATVSGDSLAPATLSGRFSGGTFAGTYAAGGATASVALERQ